MIRGAVLMASCAASLIAAPVAIRFQAMVSDQKLLCGQYYENIGTTHSRITPRDFRFYVHNIRLIDDKGAEVPVDLDQDGKWQLDDLALLDFEN
ncbi:MAG TPA: MbnP family protein, partial [Bryobacteraceae bacterium]|nr:MbnP family protein [Bryobacteraceae bacterium]